MIERAGIKHAVLHYITWGISVCYLLLLLMLLMLQVKKCALVVTKQDKLLSGEVLSSVHTLSENINDV